MLVHVVMFTLTDSDEVPAAVDILRGMGGKIPSLLGMQVGTNVREDGHHLALVTKHADSAGLADYIAHPIHEEVLAWLRPRISDRVAVDFEDQDDAAWRRS